MKKTTKTPKTGSDFRPLAILAGAVILALIFVAAIVLSVPAGTPTGQSDAIRIGAIYNLNGSQSSLDIPSARGARLAAAQINERGGIGGRQVILTEYDGKTNTTEIAADADRLIGTDHVQVIIGMSDSDMVLPAARVAAGARTVFVTSGATSPLLPGQVPGYLYLACYGDNTQAAAAAEFAQSDLNATTALVVMDNSTEYTRLLPKYFMERFAEGGGTITKVVPYEGSQDIPSVAGKLSGTAVPAPGVVLVACGPEDCGAAIRAVRAAGITAPVIGGDSMDSPKLAAAAGPDAGRIVYTTHGDISTSSADPDTSAFIKRYYIEYGEKPNAFAALGYDTVNVAAQAAALSPSDIRAGLVSLKTYDGLTGTIAYHNNAQIPEKSVTLMELNGGTVRSLGERVPRIVPAP
ncbi:ABC transporter substrate-binding protein [Methanoregula sp. UBA64]|jgi:branched-chain amino acid transport system substrate-binding protein|uniref:ABC transporter substrate-binding protein n=1 Tax=Methanoregula sp. UBA64 TaxID=1915554 RepID=UPI0025E2F042|nr:ABC transporter substrate-binding protein [Methanoregula sp. UBA64]